MIAVCLLTCDRRQYTETTLRTFAIMNDRSRFLLLHADDASTDATIPELAQDWGFETVVQSKVRQGWLPMRTRLFEQAEKRGADWVLFLENDIEWAREFPWPLFEYVQKKPQFYCLRLYGAFKDRAQQDAGLSYNKIAPDRSRPVKWLRLKYAPEPAQGCWIHWSSQPSVTKIAPLLDLHRYGMGSSDMTARVLDNVTYHIGKKRTQELVAVPA